MKDIRIISRADDIGSTRSANAATLQVIQAGFIKNVSLMAVGPYIDEAFSLLGAVKNVCYGLHATLNAEWDTYRWKPLTKLSKDSGLVDEQGYFLATPSMFLDTKPDITTALAEYEAQLDKLTRLGFDIRYVDSHMHEEGFVEGLADAKRDWATKKGLLFGADYRNVPPKVHDEENLHRLGNFLASLASGQYVYVIHPSFDDEETRGTGNSALPGSEVARVRNLETTITSDSDFINYIRANGVTGVRYDEATPIL